MKILRGFITGMAITYWVIASEYTHTLITRRKAR